MSSWSTDMRQHHGRCWQLPRPFMRCLQHGCYSVRRWALRRSKAGSGPGALSSYAQRLSQIRQATRCLLVIRKTPAPNASAVSSWPAKLLNIAALLALTLFAAPAVTAQLAPPSTGGVVALDYLLQGLSEYRRALVIGAHPDDEDTSLLALLARDYGAKAAYLALSRGEGGQNLIGNELGVGLGLLRSRELEAARGVDGARQFFTRSYDFGYSRSLEEASQFWPPDSVLKDVIRVVRRFRPHVIVSVFSGTARDGHGQHQAAGSVAKPAFEAAGDPARFPELETEEGLPPWTPLKLYRSTRFDPGATTIEMSTGILDPRTGRTFYQIAMGSRSQHRSQDMGRIQRTGPATTRLMLIEDRTGREGPDQAIFDGIPRDNSWLPLLADSLRATLSAPRVSDAAPVLARALVRAESEGSYGPEIISRLHEALAVSAGLVLDGRASTEALVPGQPFQVTVDFYNGGPYQLTVEDVSLVTPSGWHSEVMQQGDEILEPAAQTSVEFSVTVPEGADPSQPYFLRRPMHGAQYDWSAASPSVRGRPFEPPSLEASVRASLLGANVIVEREVSYRYNDQATGEVRRPLRVVPAIDVKLSPDIVVWPATGPQDKIFTVALTYNGSGTIEGSVGLEADGWRDPAQQQFILEQTGESRTFRFRLTRPLGVERAEVKVQAVARTNDGRTFDKGIELVGYSHIRPVPHVTEPVSDVRVAPITLPNIRAVGYVRGAADRVPQALSEIGLPIEILDADALASADLSRFDAIVVGSRAYEIDTALVRHNDRLFEYMRGGGLLLVQYQQYQFAAGRYAPYPLTINRPHDRVTDETAPVTVLQPDHPAFTVPNRIIAGDWEGWPQERGLYFAGTWDEEYTPLLEMADPGLEPLRGALLVTPFGEGTYVYTGISFFRSLPAGVPGAYKLFLNLLALNDRTVP
jgi:LmbE family N-acetylglucosaminyl deacetylase